MTTQARCWTVTAWLDIVPWSLQRHATCHVRDNANLKATQGGGAYPGATRESNGEVGVSGLIGLIVQAAIAED